MKLLVTGGAGFIGSNFIRYALRTREDWEITNVDKLTYAANLNNLKDIEVEPCYRFVRGDIADRRFVGDLLSETFDVVVNFAAESHVDRSIVDATPFVETNVMGVQTLLDAALRCNLTRFVQVSTDEVYGSADDGERFSEGSCLRPNSPYAATKAAADLLCLAYWRTHRLPVIITRSTNNFGPWQFPEKLIPLAISNALENKPIPLYGDGLHTRNWIFVEDHCHALCRAIERGHAGHVYNIASGGEISNLSVVKNILSILGKPAELITFMTDRPGHDRHYSLNCTKVIAELGWSPKFMFREGLALTVNWYVDNRRWWESAKKDAAYRGHYAAWYERRMA